MGKEKLAIIGSGATAIYFLKHLADDVSIFSEELESITVFEKSGTMGMGMPYNPENTDVYNMANISSEEIPELPSTFANWLRAQNEITLQNLNVKEKPVRDTEVYSRVALGHYFHEQYTILVGKLQVEIEVIELTDCLVKDIVQKTPKSLIKVVCANKKSYEFSKVVIATGHTWNDKDRTKQGYFASPWPIKKILPEKGKVFDFTIGTLGASLSAFDVVTSLAHRHGKFVQHDDGLLFKKAKDASKFKIVMHSAEGWLPHLQYEQEKAMREIYRHTNKNKLMSIVDSQGFLSLESYYTEICRPALFKALRKDKKLDTIKELEDSSNTFQDFIDLMTEQHEYLDSFDGMRKEMVQAKNSVENHRPIHWKETLDDLMYCLNFHAELLPAEDHLFLKKRVMPFLMNVIAALPLSSASILLALDDADCIELITGKAEILESQKNTKETILKVVDENRGEKIYNYEMFINCAGQKNIELEDYPFQSLVKNKMIRKARAKFNEVLPEEDLYEGVSKNQIFAKNNDSFLYSGGIEIDAAYHIIGENGNPNPTIHDITFSHTSGCRPYSYGLQACSATSKIVIEAWKKSITSINKNDGQLESVATIYEKDSSL